MADGRGLEPHLAADDDGAGPGVDDDLGCLAGRIHLQVLDGGEIGDPLARVPRCVDLDRGGIKRLRRVGADQIVDHVRQPARRGEIGAVQVEGDGIPLAK